MVWGLPPLFCLLLPCVLSALLCAMEPGAHGQEEGRKQGTTLNCLENTTRETQDLFLHQSADRAVADTLISNCRVAHLSTAVKLSPPV